jgi:hypothetical protein
MLGRSSVATKWAASQKGLSSISDDDDDDDDDLCNTTFNLF